MGLDMWLNKRGKSKIEKMPTEVAYWRKANQIHKWFVENVQNNIDDCGEYIVPKEKLEELIKVCEEVINNSELIDGKINNGKVYKNGEWEPIVEEGKVIKDSSKAEELLPTANGFFFGSTDYDEYYLNKVQYTLDTLKEILESTNFEESEITYNSSW